MSTGCSLVVIIRIGKAYVQQLAIGPDGTIGDEQVYVAGLEPGALAWALEQAYSPEPKVQRNWPVRDFMNETVGVNSSEELRRGAIIYLVDYSSHEVEINVDLWGSMMEPGADPGEYHLPANTTFLTLAKFILEHARNHPEMWGQ